VKILALLLALLLATLQYALWFGDGGIAEVRRLERAVATQRAENDRLARRNELLAAEVIDLKEGLEAIEERARHELGMIRADEAFYQIVD